LGGGTSPIIDADIANRSALDDYFVSILQLIFTRLANEQTDSYKANVTRFYHLISAKAGGSGLGADYFIKHAETIQAGVFTQFYLTIILPTTKQFAQPVDRKLGVVSYAKTLGDSKAFAERYAKGWAFTCDSMLDLLKNEASVTAGYGDDIINEADVDDIGFGIGFTPLLTLKRGSRDDFPEITNINAWVRDYLKSANERQGGALVGFVNTRGSAESKALMGSYLQ
jgi:exportin-2 (importin alpha re-exporter)